jgi:hypothetical protein
MTFNIHNQHANVINQAAGNQWVNGGQHMTVTTLHAARDAVMTLQQALETAPLDPANAASVRTSVDELGAELRKDHPDAPAVAHRLHRLTSLLKSTGALATAGTALLDPLRIVAGWLGNLGEGTLQLLS